MHQRMAAKQSKVPGGADIMCSNLTGVSAMAVLPEFIEDLRQRVPLKISLGVV